ncbi:hypothetical protein [Neisseria iguanae]|uniref:hypothetical protein n=1 Tax=Neisseria iguanae TaxID=90242 RepID=UPI001FEA4B24|nr:hypothetical protein [Neisseria iguanae]
MNPWVGALEDNLEALVQQNDGDEFSAWAKKATSDSIRVRIKVRSQFHARAYVSKQIRDYR